MRGKFDLIFLFTDVDLIKLQNDMVKRKQMAFRPGTTANHWAQWKLYFTFCEHFKLQAIQPSEQTVCLYMEFLSRSFVAPNSIQNYVSGVRTLHKMLGVECTSLDSFGVKLMSRAILSTFMHSPYHRPPLSIRHLSDIVRTCLSLGEAGIVLKCAFVFLFFGCLRQSNIAPTTVGLFDARRNTSRGDILFHPPGLIFLMKWSKTLQGGNHALIPLPTLSNKLLCPVKAFLDMCDLIPAGDDSPLLLLKDANGGTNIVTLTFLKKCFKNILESLNIKEGYTLHSFRSGGAHAAFHGGAATDDVKTQGTWKSNICWKYIQAHPDTSSVPKVFEQIC
jgi:hypothetical protein